MCLEESHNCICKVLCVLSSEGYEHRFQNILFVLPIDKSEAMYIMNKQTEEKYDVTKEETQKTKEETKKEKAARIKRVWDYLHNLKPEENKEK